MEKFLLGIWHGLPLLPLIWQKYVLCVVGVLVVFLPYIKVKKLRQQMDNISQDFAEASDATRQELATMGRTMEWWKRLTFLS